jgi:hypothetical protein
MADGRATPWQRAADAWAQGVRRWSDRVGDLGAGTRSGGSVVDAYAAYVRQLAELGVDYVTSAVRLSQELQDRVWDSMSARRPSGATNGPPSSHSRQLVLHGPIGGTARSTFVVETSGTTVSTINLHVTDLVDSSGRVLGGAVTLDPSRFSLHPGDEASVAVRANIVDGAFFVPGEPVRCTVTATGRPDLDLDIVVIPERGIV